MYLQAIDGFLLSQRVLIRYDCSGGHERCGKEYSIVLKIAQKNAAAHNGLHICRQCQLKANNPAKRKEVQAKMKATCIKRYGTELPLNSLENIEKRREQFQDEEFKAQWAEKRRQTLLERYGVEHQMHLDQTKKKIKETCLERYGVDNARQSEESKQKSKETCLEKHGVEFTGQIPGTREQASDTMEERYGVRHYNELPEMQDYLREHCREWLAESWANPWAKGIKRPEEWNQKQSMTMAQKIINREISPEDSRFYVTGYYSSNKCKKQKAFFRSSLELQMHYLLDNDPSVLWYENEPFVIPYNKSKEEIRHYVPDFFVMRNNGSQLLEIKPAFRLREVEVIYKVDAGKSFAEKNNMEFVYIDEKFLKANSLSLKELQSLPNVEIIQNKKPA